MVKMSHLNHPKVVSFLNNLVAQKRIAGMALCLCTMMPTIAYAQVSIASPAASILQVISAAFAIIAGIGVSFCTIAGIFGFAQWTRLLNLIGWIVAGGGGLALATWAASQAV